MKHYFPSKKSVILGTIIWGLILGLPSYNLYMDFDSTAFIIMIIVWVPLLPLIGTVWFRTGYFIKDETLIVKIGPYTEREIDISNIISAKRSYNVLASAANSLKRLKIKYRGGMILISPTREE